MTEVSTTGRWQSWTERLSSDTRYYRLLQQFILVSMSGTISVSKLALAFYTARYLGLADLGIYGLLVGAATIVPAVFGFGLTDYVSRQLVGLKTSEAIPLIVTRLAVTLLVYLVGLPAAWAVNVALGMPVSPTLFLLVGAILLLTHPAVDLDQILLLRGHVYLANFIAFINSGLWAPVVIVWGLLDPSARTIEHLLFGWLVALILSWALPIARLATRQRWRSIGLRWTWLRNCIRPSVPFYLNNVNAVGRLYVDRFLVVGFLGLELTGVYTFFWSVANTMHILTFAITQPYMGKLVAAGHNVDLPGFRRLEHRLILEIIVWALFLGTCAAIVVHFLLPFMDQPLLGANQAIVWTLLIATVGRLMADIYGFILYALQRDRAYVGTSIAGTLVSATLNAALLPLAGLHGAAAAFLLTNVVLLIVRVWLSRNDRILPRVAAPSSLVPRDSAS